MKCERMIGIVDYRVSLYLKGEEANEPQVNSGRSEVVKGQILNFYFTSHTRKLINVKEFT